MPRKSKKRSEKAALERIFQDVCVKSDINDIKFKETQKLEKVRQEMRKEKLREAKKKKTSKHEQLKKKPSSEKVKYRIKKKFAIGKLSPLYRLYANAN